MIDLGYLMTSHNARERMRRESMPNEYDDSGQVGGFKSGKNKMGILYGEDSREVAKKNYKEFSNNLAKNKSKFLDEAAKNVYDEYKKYGWFDFTDDDGNERTISRNEFKKAIKEFNGGDYDSSKKNDFPASIYFDFDYNGNYYVLGCSTNQQANVFKYWDFDS